MSVPRESEEVLVLTFVERGAKAFVLGEGHEKKLLKSIDDIRKLADNSRREAEVCQAQRLESIDERTKRIEAKLEHCTNPVKLARLLHNLLVSNPNYMVTTGERKILRLFLLR